MPLALGYFLGRPMGLRLTTRLFDVEDFFNCPFCRRREDVVDFVAEVFFGIPVRCEFLIVVIVGSFFGRPFGRRRAAVSFAVARDLLDFLLLGRFLLVGATFFCDWIGRRDISNVWTCSGAGIPLYRSPQFFQAHSVLRSEDV